MRSSPAGDVPSDTRAWLAFASCGAIWGSTFLVISIGNDALAPLWAATLRLSAAAVLLALWTRARGEALPRGRALSAALAYGVCQFGINFPLLYLGEKSVPSGVCAVVYATVPLSSAFFTRAFGLERLTAAKVIGALTAFAGVAILFSGSRGQHVAPLGLVAVLIGATSASLGTVFLKRGPRQSPIGANAVASAIGATMCAVLSLIAREHHLLPATVASALPLVYLTLAGSLGAYVIMTWLLHHWSVSRTSYVTVIVPVIALALGSVVRHERLTPVMFGGAALVLVGLLIGTRGAPAAVAHPAK